MPTYQYACTNEACALKFERVQSFTDAAIAECPDCGGPVRKVYGSVGVVFKGSGFYRNDSRDAKSGAVTSKSDTSASSTNSDSSSSSGADKSGANSSPSKSDSSSATKSSGSETKTASTATK